MDAPTVAWTDETIILADPHLAALLAGHEEMIPWGATMASEVLFGMTGGRWPGEAEVTVRPSAQRECVKPELPEWMRWEQMQAAFSGGFSNGAMGMLWGFCRCSSAQCTCRPRSRVTLGYYPVISVSEVKVDGLVIDPAAYILTDRRFLNRIDDGVFPYCQHWWLPDTEDRTMSVTMIWGENPPPGGVLSASELATQLILARAQSEECRMADRVTAIIRQGVTMQMTSLVDALKQNMTGIDSVDLWVRQANGGKDHFHQPMSFSSPDVPVSTHYPP